MFSRFIFLLIGLLISGLLSSPTIVSALSIVYDNTGTGSYLYTSPEVGDQITLAGSERLVREFTFRYGIGNAPGEDYSNNTVQIRFYENDGPGGFPGSLLYDSGAFLINSPPSANPYTFILSNLSVLVPDTFTWTILFSGIEITTPQFTSIAMSDPPGIGSSDDFFWMHFASTWVQFGFPTSIDNLYAQVKADPIPEPSSFLLIAIGLSGIGILRRRFKN